MEHNLPAVTMAVMMNADIIKIDTVLSADNEVIVTSSPKSHNPPIAFEIFPDRAVTMVTITHSTLRSRKSGS